MIVTDKYNSFNPKRIELIQEKLPILDRKLKRPNDKTMKIFFTNIQTSFT